MFYGCFRRRPPIYAEGHPIKKSDSLQMGPSAGESLGPPFIRAVTQNGCENKNVGGEDEDNGVREQQRLKPATANMAVVFSYISEQGRMKRGGSAQYKQLISLGPRKERQGIRMVWARPVTKP